MKRPVHNCIYLYIYQLCSLPMLAFCEYYQSWRPQQKGTHVLGTAANIVLWLALHLAGRVHQTGGPEMVDAKAGRQ